MVLLTDDQKAEALANFKTSALKEISHQFGEETRIWGVRLTERPAEDDPEGKKRDAVLSKFLRANEYDQEKAHKQLLSTLKWRKENNIDSLLDETFEDHFNCLGFVHQTDVGGAPLVFNIYSKIDVKLVFPGGSTERFIRWRLSLMERTMSLCDFTDPEKESSTQVHDYNNVSLSLNLNKSVKESSRALIKIFQDYYPETLKIKFFINVPWFFEAAYNVIALFVDEKTKRKFVVCSKSASVRQHLLESISPEVLPTDYGGLCVLVDPLQQISSSSTSSSSSSGDASTKQINGVTFEDEEGMETVTIKSGQSHTVCIDFGAEDVGKQMLVWHVVAAANDIGFSVTFEQASSSSEETEDTSSGSTGSTGGGKKGEEVVVAMTRNAHHEGSHQPSSAGRFLFRIDNSYSLFTKKVVHYRVLSVEM